MVKEGVVVTVVDKLLDLILMKEAHLQVLPRYKKVFVPPPIYDSGSPMFPEYARSALRPKLDLKVLMSSLFSETVIYFDEHRDMIVSTDYGHDIIRPLPLFVVAIGFAGGDEGENAAIPIQVHRGYDKSGPVYGCVDKIERHAQGTLNNHTFNPSAPFATTGIDISTHFTKGYCTFEFRLPSPSDPAVLSLQKFKWKQCEGDAQVVDLCKTRTVDAHDWCWIERKNKRGMKLFHEATGEVLAVYVAGKIHSRMNPVRIAAKVRWLESALWTEELKLASFLALMTYAEISRRVGTGSSVVSGIDAGLQLV